MAWTQFSAADLPDLLAQLRTFLLANGWTSGGTDIVVSADSFAFTLSAGAIVNQNTYSAAGTLTTTPDRLFNVQFNQAGVGGAGLSAIAGTNDMVGPFPNVWVFASNTFCNFVAQVASNRYSHGSFGSLDGKGITPLPVAFHVGQYYIFWENRTSVTDNDFGPNYIDEEGHEHGHFGHNLQNYVGVPDGVADPTLNFADGPILNPTWLHNFNLLSKHSDVSTMGDTYGYYLDLVSAIENKAVTGGVPLMPLPVVILGTANVQLWLGELPNIAFCQMNGLSPAQTITYAGADWIVFPVKQLGIEENTRYGNTPLRVPNSVQYGFAYRKA